jgi:Helix-turn-helix domain
VTDLSIEIPPALVETIAQRVAEILAPRFAAAPASPYMTIQEAAEYLRCNPQRIYDLRSAGVLTKHGRLVSRAELDASLLPPDDRSRMGNGARR